MSERIKTIAYSGTNCNRYFWRTNAQQEIDYIEERNGAMTAYEFKWNPTARAKISATFLKGYPNSDTMTVTRDNFEAFLIPGFA